MITVDWCWPLGGGMVKGGFVGHALLSAGGGGAAAAVAAMGRCAAAVGVALTASVLEGWLPARAAPKTLESGGQQPNMGRTRASWPATSAEKNRQARAVRMRALKGSSARVEA